MPEAQIVIVTQAESGQKLLQFLERRLRGAVPRPAIQRWIRKGSVRVDKGRRKPFDRIQAGQAVRIPPYDTGNRSPHSPPPHPPPENARLTIAYQDAHLLGVAKPAGLAAHGGDKVDDSVAARLSVLYRNDDFRPTLVHRLDRDTSGLLLAARDYATLRRLNDLFATGGVAKVYLAWVVGAWPETDTVLLEDRLEKRGAPGAERVGAGSGKPARARVTPLAVGRRFSLLAVRLLTGRTHQIRVQLASRGHPVVGDRKYGRADEHPHMRLHCYAMRMEDRTLTLPPRWSGRWEVGPDALREGLRSLFD
ncbi:RluA family pseudouridine synthase [Pseudodesulfovibrio sp.]|uniref:RluA family pseudouridine synthase n=1 Tax=Pseudodesulfovibrio sp. TaxID=2035812 RepID=UPI0026238308|nr:RluA family pseudouridine synthase [Pseudodesulfovibrio sp.]MDD3313272.1 RluA family pseudouridine synthase [Pseudodesulfovibrio sp.]